MSREPEALLTAARRRYHQSLLGSVLTLGTGNVPSNAGIALGTGDDDCVCHFALPELIESVAESAAEDAAEMLRIMVDGKRLKDIADLPLDLAV